MSTQKTADVPHVVQAGLNRTDAALRVAHAARVVTNAAKARKMGRIAELYEREVRWWRVLERWTYLTSDLPGVFGRAGIVASLDARKRAEFYRDLEVDYWRRTLRVAADSGVVA